MAQFRVLELCAGYGSQAIALKEIGLDVYSEIAEFDKYASQAYMQFHGETKNYGDIYSIDESKLPHFDMITYSTPCQDFSSAGNQKGGEKGSGTRSSLLWECERIIRAVRPKYLLMENVKNLMSDRFRHTFNEWFGVLESMGYKNYYKVLNAKDFGVPQNRERIFCVSILDGGQFLFPNPIPLEKRLKDVLESNVDEKYYLSQKTASRFKFDDSLGVNVLGTTKSNERTIGQRDLVYDISKLMGCLTATDYKQPKQILEPLAYDEQNKRLRTDGTVGTLTTDGSSPKHNNRVVQLGNIIDTGNWSNPQRGRIYSINGCSPSLNTCQGGGLEPKIYYDFRIRKLTPHECFRLMGVPDKYFERLHDLSNTQLYKLSGNSIVVDVLKAIFINLITPEKVDTKGQLDLF